MMETAPQLVGAPHLERDMHRTFAIVSLIGALALVGCTATSPSPQASASESAAPSEIGPGASVSGTPAASEPTDGLGPFGCEPVHSPGTGAFTNITDVRVGTHAEYDRIVFEFSDGLPEFTIEPASPPFTRDASGLPLIVNGNAFWRIWLNGATKLSQTGGITYSGPTEFVVQSQLVHLIEGGDFEAVSTWYAGTGATACVRVLTLSAPDRLVIDLEH
jgi:hypothetical protein